MRTDAGEVHTVGGEFTEIRPPERLAYTWSWEEGPDAAMSGSEHTLVTVDFVEDGDGTLVKLTHSGFRSAEIREMHVQGWTAVLANLEASSPEPSEPGQLSPTDLALVPG